MTHKKVTLAKVTAKNDPPESTRLPTPLPNSVYSNDPVTTVTVSHGEASEKNKSLGFSAYCHTTQSYFQNQNR
jgi:hypothetical protein